MAPSINTMLFAASKTEAIALLGNETTLVFFGADDDGCLHCMVSLTLSQSDAFITDPGLGNIQGNSQTTLDSPVMQSAWGVFDQVSKEVALTRQKTSLLQDTLTALVI